MANQKFLFPQIIALFQILRARCGGQKRVPKLSDDCFPMLIQFGQERERCPGRQEEEIPLAFFGPQCFTDARLQSLFSPTTFLFLWVHQLH